MVLLPYALHGLTVAAALLVLCVVCVPAVADEPAPAFSAAQQSNTLAFLQGLAAANSWLASAWVGTDFCTWTYASCDMENFTATLEFTGSGVRNPDTLFVLPELADDVDGSEVVVIGFTARVGFPASISGTLPESWGRLTQMEWIVLDRNKLTGTLPAAWKGMSSLVKLSAYSNAFYGTLPSGWSEMPSMAYLMLADSNFSGTLPASWASMPSLGVFYGNMNSLTGSIPSEWVNLPKLTAVVLFDNTLCGCVPEAWRGNASMYNSFDAVLNASDCATANACPTTTTTTTTVAPAPTTTTTSTTAVPCRVERCQTCTAGSATVCAVCTSGFSLQAGNTTCNSAMAMPSALLMSVGMTLVSALLLL